MEQPTSESLKDLGNTAVKNEKFEEAILHYTHAIKLEPTSYTLYSNRSFAFLKLRQYYFAMEDANETIKLNPTWPKGYFRKAEVEFATQHFLDASDSYRTAFELKPDDVNLLDALTKTAKEVLKDRKADEVIPWLGAGIGIVIGVIIVLADCVLAHNPTNPVLMAFVTIVISLVGYGLARTYRYYIKCQRAGLLQPPTDLVNEEKATQQQQQDNNKSHNHVRYTKSQARQRYKKGKL